MKSFTIINKRHGALEVFVDDEDYEKVMAHTWHLHKDPKNGRFYAVTQLKKVNGKQRAIKLHRMIMEINDPKILIDHIDGNGLNNQRSSNLRISTPAQNQQNRGKARKNNSGFKGVCWHKRVKKFGARIVFNGKGIHLGYFNMAEEASAAYESKAKELFGIFYKKVS